MLSSSYNFRFSSFLSLGLITLPIAVALGWPSASEVIVFLDGYFKRRGSLYITGRVFETISTATVIQSIGLGVPSYIIGHALTCQGTIEEGSFDGSRALLHPLAQLVLVFLFSLPV